ncbi:hypothetical protein Sjap_013397 [Stephania japonica]|uniref:Uncharacterized protein n=1 Tax=Stephania japonica TaxID=461633 RepID=A0AAP0IZ16_9MAGN
MTERLRYDEKKPKISEAFEGSSSLETTERLKHALRQEFNGRSPPLLLSRRSTRSLFVHDPNGRKTLCNQH